MLGVSGGHARRLAAGAVILLGLATDGSAQYLSPSPIGGAYSFEAPNREYNGLPVGPWVLYPQLLAGVIFDDNVFQTTTNRVSSVGLRVAPSLIADLNNGIHRTTLYGSMDARLYFDARQGNAVDGRAGVIQVYEAMRDLIFRAQADYSRQTNVFTTGVQVTEIEPFVSPVGTTISNPTNQLTGRASVEKTLNDGFVRLHGSIVRTAYDNTALSPDGTVYTFAGRLGYWVTPDLNYFVEPSIDRRVYDASPLSSSGYRAIAGVATRQIGLFRGEIYGGYQVESYTGSFGDATSTVLGGRLYYEPTAYWRLVAALTRSLDVSVQPSLLSPLGTPVRTTAALLQSTYALSALWSATARIGYTKFEYLDGSRLDDVWLASTRIDYNVWQNLAITLEYQFSQLASNVPLTSYTRNVITLGAAHKY